MLHKSLHHALHQTTASTRECSKVYQQHQKNASQKAKFYCTKYSRCPDYTMHYTKLLALRAPEKATSGTAPPISVPATADPPKLLHQQNFTPAITKMMQRDVVGSRATTTMHSNSFIIGSRKWPAKECVSKECHTRRTLHKRLFPHILLHKTQSCHM